jgi:hypothetical protein
MYAMMPTLKDGSVNRTSIYLGSDTLKALKSA